MNGRTCTDVLNFFPFFLTWNAPSIFRVTLVSVQHKSLLVTTAKAHLAIAAWTRAVSCTYFCEARIRNNGAVSSISVLSVHLSFHVHIVLPFVCVTENETPAEQSLQASACAASRNQPEHENRPTPENCLPLKIFFFFPSAYPATSHVCVTA